MFNTLFYEPVFNLLIILYRALGENLGLAIIGIALISRVLLFPLTMKQIRMAESSKEFAEKSKEIKKKYHNNKEKQQEALLKLQREYLPQQLSGCLPLIFQLILFINVYSVIKNITGEGAKTFADAAYSFVPKFAENEAVNTDFFGIVDLHKTASEVGSSSTDIIPYLVLIIFVGLTQYFSVRVLQGLRNSREDKAKEASLNVRKEKNKRNKKEPEPDDFADIVQQSTKQAMMIMPFMIMFVAYSLPSGLALYWTIQSSFVIIQQLVVHRIHLKQQKLKETEALEGEVINKH